MIDSTQLVEDRPTNARNGEGAEGESPHRLESIECLDQPHRAGADQLIELDVGRDPAVNLPRNVVHQADMLGQQLFAGGKVTS